MSLNLFFLGRLLLTGSRLFYFFGVAFGCCWCGRLTHSNEFSFRIQVREVCDVSQGLCYHKLDFENGLTTNPIQGDRL